MPTYSIRLVCEEGPEPLTGETLRHVEETLTVEAPTPWAGRARAVSIMSIRAMGRRLRAYDAQTGQEIPPPAPDRLRPGQFVVDGLPGTYRGFTRGESWNGFAVPYFEFSEARRVAEDYAARPPGLDGEPRADYDDVHGTFRLYEPSAGEWDEFTTVEIEGRSLYPIGSRFWTWTEV